jgi:opacity protein-like surface antigen
VEGDFNRTNTSASRTFTGTATNFDFFGPPDNTSGVGGIPVGILAITDVTSERRVETDWSASARARLGWAKGHVLLYVTGGAAWTHVNAFANDTARTQFFGIEELGPIIFQPNANTNGIGILPGEIVVPLGAITDTNTAKADYTALGWTAGGGGEWAVTDMVSIGVEYRHNDYGGHTFNFASHGGPVFSGPMNVNLDGDQVTVRFNILLNSFFGR